MDAGTWLHGQTVFVNGQQTHQVDWDLPEVPYAHLGLPQYDTERILTGCLGRARRPGRARRGAGELHPGRRRRHRHASRSAGGRTAQVRARYLVGCDGAHSTVRQSHRRHLRGRHGHVPAAVHARRRRSGLDDARGSPAALHPGRGRGDEGHAGLRAAARARAASGWRRWRRRGCMAEIGPGPIPPGFSQEYDAADPRRHPGRARRAGPGRDDREQPAVVVDLPDQARHRRPLPGRPGVPRRRRRAPAPAGGRPGHEHRHPGRRGTWAGSWPSR